MPALSNGLEVLRAFFVSQQSIFEYLYPDGWSSRVLMVIVSYNNNLFPSGFYYQIKKT
jgi:hypothetical protein